MTGQNRSQKDQKLGHFAKFLILGNLPRFPTLRGFFDKRTISEKEELTVMNRELLERPFPPEQIKQREGAFGDVRRSGRPTRYQVGPTTEPYVRISRIRLFEKSLITAESTPQVGDS